MRTRVLTSLVGIPLFLVVAFWPGGWPLAAAVGGLATLALREFYGGARAAGAAPAEWAGYGGVWVLLANAVPLPATAPAGPLLLQVGLTGLLLASLIAELARRERAPLRNLGATWLGALYVGWLFPYLARLRFEGEMLLAPLGWSAEGLPGFLAAGETGAWVLLFAFALTWSADSGAYLVGRRWGRRRLAPVLSPGKTWEGFWGGAAFTLAAALLLALGLGLPAGWAAAAGVLGAALSPLGDLAKSAFKREIGIKDFGSLIPGHGGVLDRFDSLLFVAPALYISLLLWPS